jgi:hypothetical protein
MHYYQYYMFRPYCVALRKNICGMLKTVLQYLITALQIHYTWVYSIICVY